MHNAKNVAEITAPRFKQIHLYLSMNKLQVHF